MSEKYNIGFLNVPTSVAITIGTFCLSMSVVAQAYDCTDVEFLYTDKIIERPNEIQNSLETFYFNDNQIALKDVALPAFLKIGGEIVNDKRVRSVYDFIINNIGYVKTSVAIFTYAKELNTLSVSMRFPNNVVLTVIKSSDTMDDNDVMVNVYHYKKFIFAGKSDISLLPQYIENVNKKLGKANAIGIISE